MLPGTNRHDPSRRPPSHGSERVSHHWTATFMTVAPIAGALADRIGERPLMVAGLTLQTAGMAWLALIAEPGIAYSRMLAPLIVAGVGVSMAIPAAQNSVLAGCHGRDR
jgi:MFS family permease